MNRPPWADLLDSLVAGYGSTGPHSPSVARFDFDRLARQAFEAGRAAALAEVTGLEKALRFYKTGDRVLVVEGLSAGRTGTLLAFKEVAELGMLMWRVDVDGHRVRTIRQDYLRPLVEAPPPERTP